MFFTGYPLSSILLMGAIALFIALVARLLDSQLRLLRVVPSPIRLWEKICVAFVARLNREGRSDDALAGRGKVLLMVLLAIAALIGNVIILLKDHLIENTNDGAVETLLLSLFFFALSRNITLAPQQDEAGKLRHQIESDALRFLQRVLAPLMGWVLLGWPGVIMAITMVGLRNAVAPVQSQLARPIRVAAKFFLFPAGLVGIFITAFAAFFTSRCKPLEAMRAGFEVMLTPHKALMITLAEAMGVSLAGPKTRYGDLIGRKWLGKGVARVQVADVARWNMLLLLSHCLLVVLLLALSLLL